MSRQHGLVATYYGKSLKTIAAEFAEVKRRYLEVRAAKQAAAIADGEKHREYTPPLRRLFLTIRGPRRGVAPEKNGEF